MKIHVLYDEQGHVISFGIPNPPKVDKQVPKFGPLPKKGQYAAELEVPEELTKLKPHELIKRLQVDTKSKPHRLVSKKK